MGGKHVEDVPSAPCVVPVDAQGAPTAIAMAAGAGGRDAVPLMPPAAGPPVSRRTGPGALLVAEELGRPASLGTTVFIVSSLHPAVCASPLTRGTGL